MIVISNSYLLDEFPKPDEYSEIKQSYRFPGGETGTCAAVLASLGADVRMDGTHIGADTAALVRDFYKDRSVDLSSLCFDSNFKGLEDHIWISGNVRTPFGTFGKFYSEAFETGVRHWNVPKEADIAECDAAAVDPYFREDSDKAAELCLKHQKPYVTIDCGYDSFIHRNSAVTVISSEGLRDIYKDCSREEMFSLFKENGGGLTVITNGGNELLYGRKGGETKRFMPYKVNAVSTLGAGDSFKAGCTYALAAGMSDDELIRFASGCAAAAISRYPMQLAPPTVREIEDIIKSQGSRTQQCGCL